MAQRSSEAEGAFGDIKKNFGYSLLRRRGESGVRVESVSYTHLDVYKRQAEQRPDTALIPAGRSPAYQRSAGFPADS